jgi:hypothetical protein
VAPIKKKQKKITTTTKKAQKIGGQKQKREFSFNFDGRLSSYYFFKFFPWISIEDHIFAFWLRHELIYLFGQLTQNERRWQVEECR